MEARGERKENSEGAGCSAAAAPLMTNWRYRSNNGRDACLLNITVIKLGCYACTSTHTGLYTHAHTSYNVQFSILGEQTQRRESFMKAVQY